MKTYTTKYVSLDQQRLQKKCDHYQQLSEGCEYPRGTPEVFSLIFEVVTGNQRMANLSVDQRIRKLVNLYMLIDRK